MIFKTSKKLFAHIDADSFFASCEILRKPSLKYKYVCVGSEIVIAANYNAKRRGIKVGTPSWQVREILGNRAVILPVDFLLYNKISAQLMEYIEKNTLNIEKFSIDEAFCEITGLPELYKLSPEQYGKYIQADILKKIGIPVSIGIANTRIKAKIFSDIHKPFGVFVGNRYESEYETFQKLPFGDIPFAGKQSQKRFYHRCHTIYDFTQLSFWGLKAEVGKSMTTLWLELHGVNAFIVKKTKEPKSISRSRSFNKHKTNNREFLLSQTLGHFEMVYTRITEKSVEISEVSVMLRQKDKRSFRQSYRFPEATNERQYILEKVYLLFESVYDSSQIYRSTGVTFHGLQTYLPRQMNLFEKEFQKKDHSYELSRTINMLNYKYGGYKVVVGKDMMQQKVEPKLFIRQ